VSLLPESDLRAISIARLQDELPNVPQYTYTIEGINEGPIAVRSPAGLKGGLVGGICLSPVPPETTVDGRPMQISTFNNQIELSEASAGSIGRLVRYTYMRHKANKHALAGYEITASDNKTATFVDDVLYPTYRVTEPFYEVQLDALVGADIPGSFGLGGEIVTVSSTSLTLVSTHDGTTVTAFLYGKHPAMNTARAGSNVDLLRVDMYNGNVRISEKSIVLARD